MISSMNLDENIEEENKKMKRMIALTKNRNLMIKNKIQEKDKNLEEDVYKRVAFLT